MSIAHDGSATAFHQERTIKTTAYESGDSGLVETFARRRPTRWCNDCLDQIERLRELPNNWNSYGARAVDELSIGYAKSVLHLLSSVIGVACPRIAASPSGYVSLSWEWNDGERELDVEVLSNGLIRYAYSDDRSPTDDREAETGDLGEVLFILGRW